MFSNNHRLAKTKDIQHVFARGRGFFNSYLTVKVVRPAPQFRCTVVVSTKVSKQAVARNRIKRILREQMRLQIPKLLPGDYAIIVKPAAIKIEPSVLRAKLQELLINSKSLKA